MKRKRCWNAIAVSALTLVLISSVPEHASAQVRGGAVRVDADGVTFTLEMRTRVREFYAGRPVVDVAALPPGIRRNLQRGKPLPPGIARKAAPAELRRELRVAEGYEVVEVGLDVFLVEVATGLIRDAIMDVVR